MDKSKQKSNQEETWQNQFDIGGRKYKMINEYCCAEQFDAANKMSKFLHKYYGNNSLDLTSAVIDCSFVEWEAFLVAVLLPEGIDFWTKEVAEQTKVELMKHKKYSEAFLASVVSAFFVLNMPSYLNMRMLQEMVRNGEQNSERIFKEALEQTIQNEAKKIVEKQPKASKN